MSRQQDEALLWAARIPGSHLLIRALETLQAVPFGQEMGRDQGSRGGGGPTIWRCRCFRLLPVPLRLFLLQLLVLMPLPFSRSLLLRLLCLFLLVVLRLCFQGLGLADVEEEEGLSWCAEGTAEGGGQKREKNSPAQLRKVQRKG